MQDVTRILLAEDHGTVREGIKLLVNAQQDMEVVGEAENGAVALKMAEELQPDMVVMDISMPEMNGLAATRKLRKLCPKVKILTLTRHTDDGYLQQLIKAGVNGYVLKQSAPTELITAIRMVNSGKSYIDSALSDKVMNYVGRSQKVRGEGVGDITDRESEVLRLIAWGYSNKEIAQRLNVSVKTIEAHKNNTMKKMGMTGRIDIVRYAILQGWLQDN